MSGTRLGKDKWHYVVIYNSAIQYTATTTCGWLCCNNIQLIFLWLEVKQIEQNRLTLRLTEQKELPKSNLNKRNCQTIILG